MSQKSYLEQRVTETLETLNESARETYINALKQSLRIDANFMPAPGRFPNIATPQDIARDGLSVDDQYKLRVSTLKPVALEFLIHDAHIPERGLAGKLNWKNYEKRFERQPYFIHQKPLIMMLTFAEWLHLVLDKPPQIDLEILQAWQ
jgi:hypothetical protein